ncbi:hypothetical protein DTW90_34575 [Neorhizobium sp. P12A]|nr:hypothetical protein DTW90_34575 [Neorhizobium sp. P12A]
MQMKVCNRCSVEKHLGEFHTRRETGRPRAECKECYRKAVTDRRDPIANRARVKAWQAANPEKRKALYKKIYEGMRTDISRWAASNLRTSRAYCRKRGIPCEITGADVASLFDQQQGKCALTGRPMVFGSKGQQRDSLSIDRIDAEQGYIIGNVRLVTYQANMARGMFSDDELVSFCRAVLETKGQRS